MSVYIFGVFVFLSGAFILEFLKQMLLQERKTHIKNKLKEEYTELNRNPYINLWDNGTMRDVDDCIEVISDYIASPSSSNILHLVLNHYKQTK